MRDWRTEVRGRLAGHAVDPSSETEIVEELAQHLEDQLNDLRSRGASASEAEATLLAQLDATNFAELLADRRARPKADHSPVGASDTASVLASLWQDVRYGARSLARSPAFTAVAVLSLAVGIGATTAIFSLLHLVLLERLDVRRPDELVSLQQQAGSMKVDRFSGSEFVALSKAPGLPRLAASTGTAVTIETTNGRVYDNADAVTGNYFELVGVRPLLGRLLTVNDDVQQTAAAVISQTVWENLFNADPAAIGQTVSLTGQPFTVVGVLPRSYHGINFGGTFTVAVPMSVAARLGMPDPRTNLRGLVAIVGRLTAPTTRATAGVAINTAFQRCCAERPRELFVADASRGVPNTKFDLQQEYSRLLIVLMGGVSIVLLIACANVGTLMLARATARERELAVRMSLGASRTRLVRQLITESIELGLTGAALGLLLARLGTSVLSHNLPSIAATMADRVALRPSAVILQFALAVTLGCTLLFGVAPAIRATRVDIMSPLKDGARARRRRGWSLDRGLVVAQIALALVLICAATLFVATVRNLREFDGGYRTSRVLAVYSDTRSTPYERGGIIPLYRDMMARVSRVPGVSRVGMASTLPVFGGMRSRSLGMKVSGYAVGPDEETEVATSLVTPGFFDASGIGLRMGRDFDGHDTETAERVAIVNTAFAKRYYAGRSPIGETIAFAPGRTPIQWRIVGVANDASYDGLHSPASPMVYTPVAQGGDQLPYLNFVIRTESDPADVAQSVTRAIDAAVPGIRIRRLATLEQFMNEALARERLSAALATVFGFFALGLAAVGLYGVVAYNVSRRTAEIGVRMALGATPLATLWLVVRQTLILTTIGLGVGAPLAYAASRAIGAQLYGIGANDPRALLAAAGVLALAGVIASVVPARRAASVDPVVALRSD